MIPEKKTRLNRKVESILFPYFYSENLHLIRIQSNNILWLCFEHNEAQSRTLSNYFVDLNVNQSLPLVNLTISGTVKISPTG